MQVSENSWMTLVTIHGPKSRVVKLTMGTTILSWPVRDKNV